jgi:hypothetical protein
LPKKPHKYTTNTPKARKKLLKLCEKLEKKGCNKEAKEISRIVENLMIRKPGMRRAKPCRVEVTDAIRDAVIWDLRNTDLPQETIAQKHNIDGGRVSEIYRSIRI